MDQRCRRHRQGRPFRAAVGPNEDAGRQREDPLTTQTLVVWMVVPVVSFRFPVQVSVEAPTKS